MCPGGCEVPRVPIMSCFYVFTLSVSVGVRFCQLNTNQSQLGKGVSAEELPLSDWPVGVLVGHFLNYRLACKGPVY